MLNSWWFNKSVGFFKLVNGWVNEPLVQNAMFLIVIGIRSKKNSTTAPQTTGAETLSLLYSVFIITSSTNLG